MNNQITIADLADSPILGNSKEVMAYLESYTPKDEVEMMLVTQMALCHNLVLGNVSKSKSAFSPDPDALKNAAVFKRLFNKQVHTLKRYRKYSGPSISFNNIVAGNAVVGDINPLVGQ